MKRKFTAILVTIILVFNFSLSSYAKEKSTVSELGKVLSTYAGKVGNVCFDFASEFEMIESMKLVCENVKFRLYCSESTAAIALEDKSTGDIFTSNPYNAAKDLDYSGTVAQKLDSQVIVTYLEEDVALKELYSSTDCVNLGQYKINYCEKGVSVEYSVGEEKNKNPIPVIFPAEAYEKLYASAEEEAKDKLDIYYSFYLEDSLESGGITEVYPDMNKQDVYYCDIELNDREKRNLGNIFAENGYDSERYIEDLKKLGISENAISYPNFKFRIDYLLTEDGITASIPNDSIEYFENYPLLEITLLPYFGSDTPSDTGNGYLFIPDGSGAVIDINEQSADRRIVISGKVYGEENSHISTNAVKSDLKQYYLPVYGIVRNNGSGLFAVIQDGDANAEIFTNLGRPNGNYYSTHTIFHLTGYEPYQRISQIDNPWSNKSMYLYDKNFTKDDLTVSYYVLNGEKASYSGMAQIYHEILFGDSEHESISQDVLNLRTIGSALVESSFLGVRYNAETVFTSYDDNISLLNDLSKEGIDDIALSLCGWSKNGLDTSISNKLRVSNKLGGIKKLKHLSDYCDEKNIPFTTENEFVVTKFDRMFDGFSVKRSAVKTLDMNYAKYSSIRPDTMTFSSSGYIISADSYEKFLNKLQRGYVNKKINGTIGLGQIGTMLNSNFSNKNRINRSQAKEYIVKSLSRYKDTLFECVGANAYVLPYIVKASEIPCTNSGISGESHSVPFVQLVMSGNVKYSSVPINLSGDIQKELLYCIQAGTTPTFLISYDNTELIKKTNYTEYYAVDYKILKSSVIDCYEYINKAFSRVKNARMVGHQVIADGISKTEYENSVSIYVNLTDNDYSNGNIEVKANDYFVCGEEKT